MTHKLTKFLRTGVPVIGGMLLPVLSVFSQGLEVGQSLHSSGIGLSSPDTMTRDMGPVFTLERTGEIDAVSNGLYNQEAINLGITWVGSPTAGLNLSAGAWLSELNQRSAQQQSMAAGTNSGLPQLDVESAQNSLMSLDTSFPGTSIESSGVDLGASYVWELDNVGQFTLSSKASFVSNFSQQNGVMPGVARMTDEAQLIASPELQGSLMLTWSLGNHSASAVTNYFDSFKNINDLNIEEINQLVDDITTVDLQYGYTVKQGKQSRAIISFGIKNVFDKKTVQILNQNSNVVDQKGRVAYGSIKYQF